MSPIQVTGLKLNGNRMDATFELSMWSEEKPIYTPEYVLGGIVKLQAKCCSTKLDHVLLLFKFNKIFKTDLLQYTIHIVSQQYGKDEKFLLDDANNHWWQIYEKQHRGSFQFQFNLTLDVIGNTNALLASLGSDTQLADFELCGIDGSVQMHKAILAAVSPFIKTMLDNSGQWKEVASGSVQVPNTSKQTLQHLKDYIYLQKMPDNGVMDLAILASYFMMSDLEQCCSAKLAFQLTAENVGEYLAFAMKYNMKLLFLAIFLVVKSDLVKIHNLENIVLISEKHIEVDTASAEVSKDDQV